MRGCSIRAIQLQRHATPEVACACIDLPDVGEPGPGEVVVVVRAAAINPADLLIFEGRYPGPDVPALVGIEGAGLVEAVGAGVTELMVGDHVMSLGRANWSEKLRGPVASFLKLPKELAWSDAAQLKANPPSALLMLATFVDLEPGDWLIQNAANSAVGRHLVRFAQQQGIKTANIVRRQELVETMQALGADLTVVDGPDTVQRIREGAGEEARLRLGIDAIGGSATAILADALSDGATVVNYGFLSGEPCHMSPSNLIVRGQSLQGFWLAGFMRTAAKSELEKLYAKVAAAFIDKTLDAPVEATYSVGDIAKALAHANREARSGKILLEFNQD